MRCLLFMISSLVTVNSLIAQDFDLLNGKTYEESIINFKEEKFIFSPSYIRYITDGKYLLNGYDYKYSGFGSTQIRKNLILTFK